MTRRNDKRNNRRNRQRNNQPELSSFAQMLFGAILGKGAEMIANKMKETQEKPITYGDVLKELYLGKTAYWIYDKSIEYGKQSSYNFKDAVNCTSVAQAKRMVAFNKLQNIAKYLNGDWKPDFDGDHENWNINKDGDTFIAMYTKTLNKASVYFKSEDLALEAIRLMGEYSLNDLFSTDW